MPFSKVARKGLAKSYQITTVFPLLTVFENVRIAAQAAGHSYVFWRPADGIPQDIDQIRVGQPTKLRFKRNLAYAAQLCTEAVDTLHTLAGANGIYERYPLERIFRDQHALAGHIMHNFDTQASAWGYAALGGVIDNPTL